MDQDENLETSREENGDRDFAEEEAPAQASEAGTPVMGKDGILETSREENEDRDFVEEAPAQASEAGTPVMGKDGILEESREENKDRDFVEDEVLSKANDIAFSVGAVLCALLSVLHAVFQDSVDYGVWTVLFGILSTVMLVKYSKLRKRRELLFGLSYLALAAAFFVFFLRDVLGAV